MTEHDCRKGGAHENPGEPDAQGHASGWQRNTAENAPPAEGGATDTDGGILTVVPPEPFEDLEAPYTGPVRRLVGSWEPHGWPAESGAEGREPVAHVGRATAGAPSQRLGFRLRRRGILTRSLEQAMVLSDGRWKDLTGTGMASAARAWLGGYMGIAQQSKMEFGGLLIGSATCAGDDNAVPTVVPTVWVPFGGNKPHPLLVAPELVAELSKRRMFRSLTSVLLGSLRGRAVMWAEEKGLSAMDLVRVMPGSIALALLPMPDEVEALRALRGPAGVYSSTVLAALERGVLQEASSPPLGDFLRRPLAWLFKKSNPCLLAPGVGTLTLPA